MRLVNSAYLSILVMMISCISGATDKNSFDEFLNLTDQRAYDLLIQGVTYFDSVDFSEPDQDILIDQNRIVYVGQVVTDSLNIETIISSDSGMIVSPGFIDLHAHGNPLKDYAFENFLAMGVTTICLGQDGTSPNYDDIGEWMSLVENNPLGVNICMFVGHGTLRLLSNVLYKENPSEADFALMDSLANRAMESGCFGMTSGLEYSPGKFANLNELERLAAIIGSHNGMIMSHVRNEDDPMLESSFRELIALGQYAPVHISHIKSVYGKGKSRAEELLQLIDSAANTGIEVSADQYPYLASYTGLGILFPDWAKPPNDYQEVISQKKKDLLEYLKQRVTSRNGPSATLFGSGRYKGKTLKEVADHENRPFEEVLLDLGPQGGSAAYFIMDAELQQRLLQSPYVGIGSDGSPTMYHPRGYGTHAKVIEDFVHKINLLPLSEALYKMTTFPTAVLDMKDRGRIQKGYFADLVIFDPSQVQARATFSDPHLTATGFKYVFVNGQISYKDGKYVGGGGQIIRKTP